MAFYQASGDVKLRDQCLAFARKSEWQPAKEEGHANGLTACQTYIDLFNEFGDKSMIQPTIDWLASGAKNTPSGSEKWYGSIQYVDSLYVGCPTLAMLGRATGDSKYYDYLEAFYWDVHSTIFDEESGLYYRDLRWKQQKGKTNLTLKEALSTPMKKAHQLRYQISTNGRKIFWSRGNGWAAACLVKLLSVLPEDYPHYDKYRQVYLTMMNSLKDRQGEDGYWRMNLDDADDFPMPESSGTGFFTYAMAWGLNNGLLPWDEFLPVAEKGWRALYNGTSEDGCVLWGQPVGGGPYAIKKEDTKEYVAGAFLLAGSEMLKLIKASGE
jgi:rhamnogalacturonyl hydrolase YesR